jgi:hypothetical protein
MSSRTLLFLVSGALAFGVSLTAIPRADAAPSYPRNIEAQLKLNYAPPCSICHLNGQTGDGTPIEPFAWSMRARGLSGDKGTLSPALSADEADNADSDGDGIPDIEELMHGTDVNSPANDCIIPAGIQVEDGQCTPGVQATPTLGCTIDLRGSRGSASFALLLGIALVGLARLRRRKGMLEIPRSHAQSTHGGEKFQQARTPDDSR